MRQERRTESMVKFEWVPVFIQREGRGGVQEGGRITVGRYKCSSIARFRLYHPEFAHESEMDLLLRKKSFRYV